MREQDSQPNHSNVFKFNAGEILFRENDVGQFFYVIQEGQVEVYKIKGKAKVPLAVLNPGQCVGEFSALDGKRRSATAIALTEVTVLKINAETLDSQIRRNPAWFRTITFSLVERLRKTNEILRRNCIIDEQLMSMISRIQAAVGEQGPGEGQVEDLDDALDDLKIALSEAGVGAQVKRKSG
jgi:CRP/FNR family transcriptional regulator, cyclic AMP receptor protein